jgi:PRTRC genetic system protein B
MNTYVKAGTSQEFTLNQALLVYGRSSYDGYPYRHPFVTMHDVIHEEGEARLGPAQLLTPQILSSILSRLGHSLSAEILPESVIARTSDMVVWWSPAAVRPMFFLDRGDEALRVLSGKRFPHPPLLFRASGDRLWIRALAENKRPVSGSKLCMAPYWNCYDNAAVCTGSMQIPQRQSVAAIPLWEKAFFESAFSHAAGVARHTRYPGGVVALWRHLQGKNRFPSKYLFPISQTLEEFVTNNDGSYANRAGNRA